MKPPTPHELHLAESIREALRFREQQRAEGATNAELAANLEKSIRAAWPKGRAWQYECDECQDTGLIMRICRRGARCNGISTRLDSPKSPPGKYMRLCARDPLSDYEHDYGVACFCRHGDRYRPAAAPSGDDAVAAAAKTQRQPTRWGR